MLLAKRFGMEYVDADGKKKTPYIIHRTSLGCYERTLAYMIEHFAGALPLWIAPEQVKLMPIADRHSDYAYELKNKLEKVGIRCSVDDRAENVKRKIRDAQMEKIPYMLVMGDKEIENGTVAVRSRKGDTVTMTADELIAKLLDEIERKVK
jgi:threonyl-tRNA synthetase